MIVLVRDSSTVCGALCSADSRYHDPDEDAPMPGISNEVLTDHDATLH